MHQVLFEVPSEQESLFQLDSHFSPSLLRCLKRNVSFGRIPNHDRTPSDWREVQANRGVASLLMPKELFSRLVRTIIGASSSEDLFGKIPEAGSDALAKLVKELSTLCAVSQQAARIRLETLGFIRDPNEPMLVE